MARIAEIWAELDMAETVRAAGNEGRARVCARRAAGMAARDFLKRHFISSSRAVQGKLGENSAYEALQTLANFPGLAPELKQAAIYLTMRVNPEFQLPQGIDLLEEARKLIGGLE